MLKIVEGDLFKGAVGRCVIAHGCNAFGEMGAGFAAMMRDRFPENFLEYRRFCGAGRIGVGQWLCVHEDDKAIFNLITQYDYGKEPGVVYVDYAAVEKGLRAVELYARLYKLPVHIPFIGAGKAQGDPEKLKAIFEEVFAQTDAMLYLKPTSRKRKTWPRKTPPPPI